MIYGLLTFVLTLAAASIAMVIGMMRFTLALIDAEPSSARRWAWGVFYAAAWAAIVFSFAALPPSVGEAPLPLAPLMLMPAGWLTFNAFWVALWVALGRGAERGGSPPGLPSDADQLARRALRLGYAGLAFVAASLVGVGAPQRWVAAMLVPGRRLASIFFTAAGFGFAAFMAGAVRLALGIGHEMSREEIEEMERQAKYGPQGWVAPGVFKRSKVKIYGRAKGLSGDVTVSWSEIANAWSSGLWRRDGKWLSIFLMMLGAAAAMVGAFGGAFALGSSSTRVVLTLCLAYGAFQAWRGIREGRRTRP